MYRFKLLTLEQILTNTEPVLAGPAEQTRTYVELMALEPPPGWMHEVFKNGRALVLIDGVDEAPAGNAGATLC